jgi:hypothetical protein
MKKLVMVLAAVMTCAAIALAEEITHNVNYKGEVNYDTSAIWKINGTKVTATAAMLNVTNRVLATQGYELRQHFGTTTGNMGQVTVTGMTNILGAWLSVNGSTHTAGTNALTWYATGATNVTTKYSPADGAASNKIHVVVIGY